jgi:hypothetical protein
MVANALKKGLSQTRKTAGDSPFLDQILIDREK